MSTREAPRYSTRKAGSIANARSMPARLNPRHPATCKRVSCPLERRAACTRNASVTHSHPDTSSSRMDISGYIARARPSEVTCGVPVIPTDASMERREGFESSAPTASSHALGACEERYTKGKPC